jgi:phospholipase/lecithinase/hemolysin
MLKRVSKMNPHVVNHAVTNEKCQVVADVAAGDVMIEAAAAASEAEIVKCFQLYVLHAELKHKYRSSQIQTNQFTAVIALRNQKACNSVLNRTKTKASGEIPGLFYF